MKVKGQQVSIREVVKVVLPRISGEVVEFTVCGVPIGFNADYENVFPRPRPPSKTINFPGGKSTKEDQYDDPAFLLDHRAYEFYKNIYLVYRGLQADINVSFDCLAGGVVANKAHLIEVASEMRAAGLSEGDIGILISAIHKASHIDEKEVDAATKGF